MSHRSQRPSQASNCDEEENPEQQQQQQGSKRHSRILDQIQSEAEEQLKSSERFLDNARSPMGSSRRASRMENVGSRVPTPVQDRSRIPTPMEDRSRVPTPMEERSRVPTPMQDRSRAYSRDPTGSAYQNMEEGEMDNAPAEEVCDYPTEAQPPPQEASHTTPRASKPSRSANASRTFDIDAPTFPAEQIPQVSSPGSRGSRYAAEPPGSRGSRYSPGLGPVESRGGRYSPGPVSSRGSKNIEGVTSFERGRFSGERGADARSRSGLSQTSGRSRGAQSGVTFAGEEGMDQACYPPAGSPKPAGSVLQGSHRSQFSAMNNVIEDEPVGSPFRGNISPMGWPCRNDPGDYVSPYSGAQYGISPMSDNAQALDPRPPVPQYVGPTPQRLDLLCFSEESDSSPPPFDSPGYRSEKAPLPPPINPIGRMRPEWENCRTPSPFREPSPPINYAPTFHDDPGNMSGNERALKQLLRLGRRSRPAINNYGREEQIGCGLRIACDSKYQPPPRARRLPKKPELTSDELNQLIQCETRDVESAWYLTSDEKKTYKKPCPKQQKAQMSVKQMIHAHEAPKGDPCQSKEYGPLLDPDPEDISPEVAAAMMFAQEQGVKLEACPENVVQHLFPDKKKIRASNVSVLNQGQKDQEELIEKSASVPSEGVSDSAYTRTMKQKGEEDGGSAGTLDLDFTGGLDKREYVLVEEKPIRLSKMQIRGNTPTWFPGFFSAFPEDDGSMKLAVSLSGVFQKAWMVSSPKNVPASDLTVID